VGAASRSFSEKKDVLMRYQVLVLLAVFALIGYVEAKPGRKPKARSEVTHIALVDMAEVFKQSEEFKTRRAALKQSVANYTTNARKKFTEVNELMKQLRQKPAGSVEAQKLNKQILAKKAALTASNASQKLQFLTRESEIYKAMYLEVQKKADRVARKNGFTLVLRFNSKKVSEVTSTKGIISRMNNLIISHDKSINITNKVIQELNKEYIAART
jgi:Skp family chaperone for outer membrane proteins